MATTETRPDVLAVFPGDPTVTIVRDPHRPGIQRARLLEYERPIWALIGYMGDVDDDEEIERTAHDYNLPPAAVRAAVAFYRDHQGAIDALLEAQADAGYIRNGTPVG